MPALKKELSLRRKIPAKVGFDFLFPIQVSFDFSF
jgi:hypothetical protein